MQDQQPLKTFIIYSSADRELRSEFIKHLKPLERAGLLRVWSDLEIPPGERWNDDIRRNLEETDLFLALVSVEFFNSDYIQTVEIPFAEQRSRDGRSILMPILLSPCSWQHDPIIKSLQMLPPDGKPVTDMKYWDSRNAAWEIVASKIGDRAVQIFEDLDFLARRDKEIEEKKAAAQRILDEQEAVRLAEIQKQEQADRIRREEEIARLAREREKARLEKERLEQAEAEKARQAREMLEQIQAEKTRKKKERLDQIQAEKIRKEKERLEQIEAEKMLKEQERLAQVEAEKARQEKERLEQVEAEEKRKEKEKQVATLKLVQTNIEQDSADFGTSFFVGIILFLAMYIFTLMNYSIRLNFFSDYDCVIGFWKTIIRLAFLPSLIMGILGLILYTASEVYKNNHIAKSCKVLLILFLIFELIYPVYHFYGTSIGLLKIKTEKPINGVETANQDPVTSSPGSKTIDPAKLPENGGGEKKEIQNVEDDPNLTSLDASRHSGFEMVRVQGGTFIMGCKTNRDSDCEDGEKPTHEVTLSTFNIGKFEVTQADWREIMGSDPSYNKSCDDCPVEEVSWDEIQVFLKKVNTKFSGKNFRLPTEAEWEFAARGGSASKGFKFAGSNNLDKVGWFWGNSGDKKLSGEWKFEQIIANNCKTQPVGVKMANELGIFDMSGNVWEWCSDWLGDYPSSSQFNPTGPKWGSYRVSRGGSWDLAAQDSRTANRANDAPGNHDRRLGFRLVSVP